MDRAGKVRARKKSSSQKTSALKTPREKSPAKNPPDDDEKKETLLEQTATERLLLRLSLDPVAVLLTVFSFLSRFYKLSKPAHVVFDELHFGKYVGLYMKNTFFFDLHPPLGKLMISGVAYLAGFDGKFKFDRIGSAYNDSIPIFWLRFVPASCGTLVIPLAYYLMLELGCEQWAAALSAFLLLVDNALLTQSRFILLEPILLFFILSGLIILLKFLKIQKNLSSPKWWLLLGLSFALLGSAASTKYIGFMSVFLGGWLLLRDFWYLLDDLSIGHLTVLFHYLARSFVALFVCVGVYLTSFYIHLSLLNKAGPHDFVMTSAFQASLEGGLASITRGQPTEVSHGSQVTLRHTHGKTCWLHSHAEMYPVRYPDKRGSSHQQQVTCYTFKDLNNWWIIKRPEQKNLVVAHPPDAIRDGEIVEIIHGITGRPLNSHDVSAPMSPHNQEVSCYVDHNVSMPPLILWKVDIVNKEEENQIWKTIQSQVRLIHVNSSQALKYSGRQLPEWAFNQMEIVTDKIIQQDDTVWNVEEHRYTKIEDEKERERDLMSAEMIPLEKTRLSFLRKFTELQYKMLFPTASDTLQNHMYSSEPLDWPLLTRGIAYWVSPNHNGQVHLIGNVVLWYSATAAVLIYSSLFIFYLMRRARNCMDLSPSEWDHFVQLGNVLLIGYLFHYLPYFFIERTMFLHHYLPAFVFKALLCGGLVEHLYHLSRRRGMLKKCAVLMVSCWTGVLAWVHSKFSVLSYGTTPLSASDVLALRWSESWDFIIHKD